MMKVLITGANGFIGSFLLRYLCSNDIESLGIDRCLDRWNDDIPIEIADLCDHDKICEVLNRFQPDTIVLNGAIKGLDTCENNLHAVQVNVFSGIPFYEYAFHRDVHLIGISSDMAFGGAVNHPSAENDPPSPANAYGIMKTVNEYLLKLFPDSAVVRTALVYGPMHPEEYQVYCQNWLQDEIQNQSHLIHWTAYRCQMNQTVNMADNIFCNPTFIDDLVRGLERIIRLRKKGVFHCCGSERFSRYEIALDVAKLIGKPEMVRSFHSPENLRPFDVTLSNQKTVSELELEPTPLGQGLRSSLQDFI